MRVDLLFLAKNRLEFTQESFEQLRRNTDWRLVNDFCIYDDGSVDGTAEYLEKEATDLPEGFTSVCRPCGVTFRRTDLGSPVLVFNDFIQHTGSEFIAKIDNDTVVPPYWLNACVDVMDASPELQCLGIEAFHEVDPDPRAVRSWGPCAYTGGIGLFRRAPFQKSLPRAHSTYFGFGDWQQAVGLTCGWINPSLPVFLLNLVTFEPFVSLSQSYIEKGWQRAWYQYDPVKSRNLWTWRFPHA